MAALATAAIVLRPADADDDALLRRVYASVRADELAQVEWSDEVKDVFLRHQFDAQDAHYREHYVGASFDVIERDGEPVGRLYVARWAEEIRIMDIALLPEHRGRGVGTQLLRDLLAEGAASGKRVSIHVERENPALRLYERLGFRQVADKGVYVLLETEGDA
jgi:ribosomal protein S18 acetylase RimI-like enzyme